MHSLYLSEFLRRPINQCVSVQVPSVYWEMTTDRVMTMEYCPGGQVNDREYIIKNNISVSEVRWRYFYF